MTRGTFGDPDIDRRVQSAKAFWRAKEQEILRQLALNQQAVATQPQLDVWDAMQADYDELILAQAPTELSTAEFLNLPVGGQKEYLRRIFGILETPTRQGVAWTPQDLAIVKDALERIPDHDLHYLQWVTLIRDTLPPWTDQYTVAITHRASSRDPAGLDTEMEQIPQGLYLHVHLYSTAFGYKGPLNDQNRDKLWPVAHEMGHVRLSASDPFSPHPGDRLTRLQDELVQVAAKATAAGLLDITHAAFAAYNTWFLAVDAIRDAIVEVDELHSRPTLVRSRWQLQMWRDVHEQWSRKLTEITLRKEQADAALDELRTALEGQGEDAVAVGRLAQQASQTTAGLLKVQKHDIIRVLQAPRAQWVATEIYNVPTWTKYGDTGTEEWYAETYARFVLDPDQMRQDNPAFFDWFKSQLEQDPIHTTPNLDNLALLPPIADLPSPDDADQPPIQN